MDRHVSCRILVQHLRTSRLFVPHGIDSEPRLLRNHLRSDAQTRPRREEESETQDAIVTFLCEDSKASQY